jgi:hypothetical protein
MYVLVVVARSCRYGVAMHYLDVHSGALQAISSAILVAITAVYTILTRTMAKAASQALRPYVYLDVSFTSPVLMTILIGNSGSRVAGNVRVTVLKANNEKLKEWFNDLPLEKGIGHLAPGSTRRYSLTAPTEDLFPKERPAAKVEFEFVYHDGSQPIIDRQEIDLAGYQQSLLSLDPAYGIVRALDDIERKMPEPRHILSLAPTKRCPYCGTSLLESARKCHGCLEWLPSTSARTFGSRRRPQRQRPKGRRGG